MSDLIAKTRELGALIQQTDEFAAVQAAMEKNAADEELVGLMQRMQMSEYGFHQEQHEDKPNESKLKAYQDEFERLYSLAMARPTMVAFQEQQKGLAKLMHRIFGILSLSADGEDPATAEPQEEHSCGPECGSDCGQCN
ncbi:MAG: YlbF family regulator [Oscillospiraceae bacterium]|jgi:cell fate (sporulation/competence/biofilm development) regulator YlbF (YheA/YmcA/DUF963 family)|nr:YlbF family regulator [Oscillospiraceae bacterium]